MDDSTSEQRTCDVCGVAIRRNNTYGVCCNWHKPACLAERRRRKLGGDNPPERPCEVCGRPIRGDNKLGVCQRQDSPECARERTRRFRAQGKAPLKKCEICGRRLRRDNATGLCNGRESPACQAERDRRKRQGPAKPEGWTAVPYIAAGAIFGRLTVLEDVPRSDGPASVRCECGVEKKIGRATDLMVGSVRSCGCLRREMNTRHGLYRHPLYRTWCGIIDRCTNPDSVAYPNYGGRGITVSERWLDVCNFIEDIEREIGPRPEGAHPNGWPLYSLDRIDNERGYESGNVRWSDQKEQVANQRTVASVTSALTAQIAALTAQLEAVQGRREALEPPRKRKAPIAPPCDTLW